MKEKYSTFRGSEMLLWFKDNYERDQYWPPVDPEALMRRVENDTCIIRPKTERKNDTETGYRISDNRGELGALLDR